MTLNSSEASCNMLLIVLLYISLFKLFLLYTVAGELTSGKHSLSVGATASLMCSVTGEVSTALSFRACIFDTWPGQKVRC